MRTLVLLSLIGCNAGSGPGITGAWFNYLQRLPPVTVGTGEAADATFPLPDGRWVVATSGGARHFYDPASSSDLGQIDADGALCPLSGGVVAWNGVTATYAEGPAEGREIVTPGGLETIHSVACDARDGLLYVSGVAPLVEGGIDKVGMVYRSADEGRTWEQVVNALTAAQGDTASAELFGVHGFVVLVVCPPDGVYDSSLPICEEYRILDGATHRGAVYNTPLPLGYDGDGRLVARADDLGLADQRITTPDLVVLDPEDYHVPGDQLDHFHLGFVVPPTAPIHIDHEGRMWTQGFDMEGWGTLRSASPLGRSHDQRDAVLDGPGCEDYYREEPDSGTEGDPVDLTLTNDTDEPVWVLLVASNSEPQQAYPGGAPLLKLEAGQTGTVQRGEDAHVVAVTRDGRCKAYGPVSKVTGGTLR